MIDYIIATKYNCKDSPYMGNCKLQKTFQESEQRVYYLDGCEKMEVRYNPQNKVLQIAGSLPYYLNGHNFAFTRSEFEKAIEIIDNSLGGVGLWGAVVNKFENGVIIPVDLSPKEYIARHSAKASTHLSKVLNEKYGGKFMILYPVCSSSKGNCSYVSNGEVAILIDVGVSFKGLVNSLKLAGLDEKKIRAIFITHEHYDHIKGLYAVTKNLKVPVYSSKETLKE